MSMFVNHTSTNLKNLPKKRFNFLENGHCYFRYNNSDELVFVDHIREVDHNQYTDEMYTYDRFGEPLLSGHTIQWEIDVAKLKGTFWRSSFGEYRLEDICDVKSLFKDGTASPTWMVVLEGYYPIPFIEMLKMFEMVVGK